ncbi:hypothetical protein Tco_0845127 [Tanacetum coccineum]
MGLAGYYRRFIENFSKIAKPLTLLTQKNQKYEWGEKQEEAFQTLKDNLFNAPILSLPRMPSIPIRSEGVNQEVKENGLELLLIMNEDYSTNHGKSQCSIDALSREGESETSTSTSDGCDNSS